ncbi:hypothetical protein EYZ11_007659 [Aspergillus tanneri]|uniref:Uncharacterized protein n=1 Tax=Aspergillus tanneri TaxID=1220188 RepID=A0A4S3JER8_9EURO|nr:hypothetical protein EYZ11_007659 [Aspergillus tanneri]
MCTGRTSHVPTFGNQLVLQVNPILCFAPSPRLQIKVTKAYLNSIAVIRWHLLCPSRSLPVTFLGIAAEVRGALHLARLFGAREGMNVPLAFRLCERHGFSFRVENRTIEDGHIRDQETEWFGDRKIDAMPPFWTPAVYLGRMQLIIALLDEPSWEIHKLLIDQFILLK